MTDACLDKRTDAMLSRSLKPRRCKVKTCREKFTPLVHWQDWCAEDCAVILAVERVERNRLKDERAREKRELSERRETREKLEAFKTLPQLKKRLKVAFNGYIRDRDEGNGCISCDKPLIKRGRIGGDYDAGHIRSVGSAPHLEWEEKNVFGQCVDCNRFTEGNHIKAVEGVKKRCGLEFWEELEADNTPRHYGRVEVRELTKLYNAKRRELKRSAL